MKIMVVNGSGRINGNSNQIVKWCETIAKKNKVGKVELKVVNLAELTIHGCTGCEGCSKTRKCVIKDDMQALYNDIETADGLVLVSPTYFYNISSSMKAFIERMYPYEVFDSKNRHVWLPMNEVFGMKYALVVGICEQADEKDMGFTMQAMCMPLQSLGYRVVDEVKVLNAFLKTDVNSDKKESEKVKIGMDKLIKTIELKDNLKSIKE